MKYCKLYLVALLIGLIFNSCQKIIEFNGSITDPIDVVNSLVTPDSVVSVQVSQSRFFLNSTPTFLMNNNARVSLIVNGLTKETLSYKSNGVYGATYKPLIGDSIKLSVKVNGKNDITCSSVIQQQATIISMDTTSILTGTNNPIVNVIVPPNGGVAVVDTIGTIIGRRLKLTLNFKDNAARKDFYRLVVYTKTYSGTKVFTDYTFLFDDIVSGNTNTNEIGPPTSLTSNKYNVFSDELLPDNGKTYPLKFSITYNKTVYFPGHYKTLPTKVLYVNLQNIDRNYFLYLQTRANVKTNSSFAESVQVYTNIDGGIGILGSYTSNVIKINL